MSKKQMYAAAMANCWVTPPYIWIRPNDHASAVKKTNRGRYRSSYVDTSLESHFGLNCPENRWRYESAVRHHWSERTVKTSKLVSIKNLDYLPSHLLCRVCLCQCKLSHGKLSSWSTSKISRFTHSFLAILANLGSEGWQGLLLTSLNGYVVCLAN